jgi:hypothetical protein
VTQGIDEMLLVFKIYVIEGLVKEEKSQED